MLKYDFEKFLQDHFGLVGPLRSELDATDASLYEEHDLEEFFTEAGWAAWERAIGAFEFMERIGLLPSSACEDVVHSFCDNA